MSVFWTPVFMGTHKKRQSLCHHDDGEIQEGFLGGGEEGDKFGTDELNMRSLKSRQDACVNTCMCAVFSGSGSHGKFCGIFGKEGEIYIGSGRGMAELMGAKRREQIIRG